VCCAARTPLVASALFGLLAIAMVGNAPKASGTADAGEVTAASASRPTSAEAAVGPCELGFEEIVFVKRKPYSSNHYYTDIRTTAPAPTDSFRTTASIFTTSARDRSGLSSGPPICPAARA